MITIKFFNELTPPDLGTKTQIIDFLFVNLQEYGDPKSDIEKCLSFALKEEDSFGGAIYVAYHQEKMVGVTILNKTGMKDYIPENILVYIATDSTMRGQGIGTKLMQAAIENTEGDIALHVEPDNPAKKLYESLGFTNKYLEMRLKNK